MKPLKPWMSYKDQLQQLCDRGLQVDDTLAALDYLERLGYYRLSGYWYPLREIDQEESEKQGKAIRKDTFVTGSRFEHVVQLYVFDKKLRLLALDALERIEMAVRVDVAYLLGKRSPAAHENPIYFHGNFAKKISRQEPNNGKTKHQVWLSKYQALLQRARKEPFVLHHKQQYGSLPIWTAIEIWDFGLLSKLFAGMKYEDQNEIANMYNAQNGRIFAQWLRSFNFIRNVSAHHSRLWNINVVERSAVPPDWTVQFDNARPFFYFCLMQQLLGVICPNSTWGQRLIGLLENEFPKFPKNLLSIYEFGIVEEWRNNLPWKKTAAQMRTDAYTKCRGVGHIAENNTVQTE